MATVQQLAAQWAIGTAADESHGYNQDNRWGTPDYDCSSFVISAYKVGAGLPIDTNYCNYTGNMNWLLTIGFVDVTSQINLSTGAGLQIGDILLNTIHHTEIVVNNNHDVCSARHDERHQYHGGTPGDQTGDEICVLPYYVYGSGGWDYVYRYGGSAGYQWTQRNVNTYGALTSDEIYANAVLTYYELVDIGFNAASAAGVLGNIEHEGQFNPAQWQGGYAVGSWYEQYCGYGMFQYTPPHKYYQDWAANFSGFNINDASINGPYQVKWLDAHPEQFSGTGPYMQGTKWYGMTWAQYKQMSDAADAAEVWARAWERPGEKYLYETMPARRSSAEYWYNEIINNFPYNPGPGPTPDPEPEPEEVKKRKKYKWVLWNRNRIGV